MPSGENVWNEALKTTRRRNIGTLTGLRRIYWFALKVTRDAIEASVQAGNQEQAMRWCHVLSQLGSAYDRCTTGNDLTERTQSQEAQIAELHKRIMAMTGNTSTNGVGHDEDEEEDEDV